MQNRIKKHRGSHMGLKQRNGINHHGAGKRQKRTYKAVSHGNGDRNTVGAWSWLPQASRHPESTGLKNSLHSLLKIQRFKALVRQVTPGKQCSKRPILPKREE